MRAGLQVTIEVSTWTGSAQRPDFWEVCRRLEEARLGLTGESLACLGRSDHWTLRGLPVVFGGRWTGCCLNGEVLEGQDARAVGALAEYAVAVRSQVLRSRR